MDSLEYNRAPDQKIRYDVEPKFGKQRKEQKHDHPQAQTTRDRPQLRIMALPFHPSEVVIGIAKEHQVEEKGRNAALDCRREIGIVRG
jgi:hypothetical protein